MRPGHRIANGMVRAVRQRMFDQMMTNWYHSV
jgi:hypothetical protein